MAVIQFIGSGDPIEAFNIDYTLVNKQLLPAEIRLRTAFPFEILELWRRTALRYTAALPVTGTTEMGTRGRTLLLFAHEADLGSIFYELVGTSATDMEGYYVDKVKAQEVERALATILLRKAEAIQELKLQLIPDPYLELIRSRLESPAFAHRVAGVCAAVYLTAILLSEADK